jgi:hypothetical protein
MPSPGVKPGSRSALFEAILQPGGLWAQIARTVNLSLVVVPLSVYLANLVWLLGQALVRTAGT